MSRLSLVVAGLGFFPEVAHADGIYAYSSSNDGGSSAYGSSNAARAYGDSTQGYDCAAGFSNWRNGWGEHQKAWCCQNRGLGCPNVNYPNAYPGSFPSEYRDVHPEYAPAPTILGGGRGRMDTYDCQAGYQNWKVGWSGNKQSYCCQSAGLGCPRVSYPDTYPGAFPPAYQEAYPDEYQHHIHHIDPPRSDTYGSSRGVDPYDCEAGLGGTWSTSKKAWCCDNFHRGCTRYQDHYVEHRQNTYVEHYNEPVDHVHVNYDYHSTARNEPYNCESNYASWEGDWPSSKKAWCCDNYRRGCVGVHRDQSIVRHVEYTNYQDGRQYYNKVEERSGAVAQQSAEQARVFGVTPLFGVVGGMTLALVALAVRARRGLQPRHPSEELLTDVTALE